MSEHVTHPTYSYNRKPVRPLKISSLIPIFLTIYARGNLLSRYGKEWEGSRKRRPDRGEWNFLGFQLSLVFFLYYINIIVKDFEFF